MRKKTAFFLVLVAIILSSCSLFQAEINDNYKRDDLSPAVIDSMGYFITAAYKMDPKYTNDLIIASFRQNALNVKNTKIYAQLLINLLSVKNKAFIDEEYILQHLDSDQQKDYRRTYPSGLPSKQSIDEIILNNPYFENTITCEGEEIDSHWAYFAATGDTKIIEKLENTLYARNVSCCFDCLGQSLANRAAWNKDVYDKLIQIRDKHCSSAKNFNTCIEYYNNWYIPPISKCDWRDLK